MNVQSIISNALIDYDSAQPLIRYLLNSTYLEVPLIDSNTDLERLKFKFIDKKSNIPIITTEVEILAVFYDKFNVWSWAWSLSGLKNSQYYLSKEILLYALKLGSELTYIKSILITSRGIIKDPNQLDINLALASSIIKQPYVYPYNHQIGDDNLIYYYILLNKDELDVLSKKLAANENIY